MVQGPPLPVPIVVARRPTSEGTGPVTRANWDDLRFVLAVIQEGSVSAAARVIGVNHATVLRRVAAFEAAHGLALFDKTARGYRIPPDRAQVIEAARDVD
ncbi:MAG: LysR family transcriptional regulator, partial [Proteobacteria bacterium]|nr:LysR family transcriptional regulator [Pseudomonadota bacterium]